MFYKFVGSVLLIMYFRCGRVNEMRNVFELMDKFDIVIWNALIFGFVDFDMGDLVLDGFS